MQEATARQLAAEAAPAGPVGADDVVPLGDVVALPLHARKADAAAAAVEISQQQHAACSANFSALVRPLEALAGRRLNGPNRSKCLAAFAAHPESFSRLVSDALDRGRSNPI